ncbi:heterokaryon incompatibility protein-domain-containing protein, partial [Amylocystis lapponica]
MESSIKAEIGIQVLQKRLGGRIAESNPGQWDYYGPTSQEDPGEVPEGKIEEVVFEKNIKDALGYAILSHRWMNGEPTFQGFKTVRWRMLPWNASAAFKKLRAFCNLARMHGCDWAWTDTCCIDKTSSAELDEAIRSMYKWYADAKICIVYLAETTSPSREDMAADAWFTRGWTLQELLAPQCVKFFNKHWQPLTAALNDKHADSGLLDALSHITGIPHDSLTFFMPGTDLIREKMHWAARRRTTRVEDVAYSLIGLFDVTLMTAYGEGARAFHRLQLAIMEAAVNVDLFIW